MSTPELNYIGIDLSGPQVRAALVSSSGKIIQRVEAQVSPENLVEQLAVIARDLGAASGQIGAIGVAIPGLINRQTDRIVSSPD
jgi:predicted NBD/HSP70 family sugar kinase